jgi:hypothetical protein
MRGLLFCFDVTGPNVFRGDELCYRVYRGSARDGEIAKEFTTEAVSEVVVIRIAILMYLSLCKTL